MAHIRFYILLIVSWNKSSNSKNDSWKCGLFSYAIFENKHLLNCQKEIKLTASNEIRTNNASVLQL